MYQPQLMYEAIGPCRTRVRLQRVSRRIFPQNVKGACSHTSGGPGGLVYALGEMKLGFQPPCNCPHAYMEPPEGNRRKKSKLKPQQSSLNSIPLQRNVLVKPKSLFKNRSFLLLVLILASCSKYPASFSAFSDILSLLASCSQYSVFLRLRPTQKRHLQ